MNARAIARGLTHHAFSGIFFFFLVPDVSTVFGVSFSRLSVLDVRFRAL